MAETTATSIEGGIEWFRLPAGQSGQEDCQCARCGSSAEYVECSNCGGEGTVEIDDADDFERPVMRQCGACRGEGGSWHCLSTPAWCQEHPMPGRESIGSTALNAEAWRDHA
jgi:hypothetical protein